ncbi:MAG: hypothetical protein UX09_C0027G0003 [Candidatus Uhrbacteria bacterium GW2011_GWE2_45_35]|uniref:Uncharacterized protein n=2 Tax=Candidatus Uhriibacteriota TaxID=1752732 RepID=A0A0G1JIA3_9BACT|nr:MAG: hypothetical protein UW63_C0019G0011 [Candidatus Uhrbacteria bacterium GW2011_GWF2_44_350]KKU07587.1 MAG: hypothetical protein UX09_C0027G0003 [Candidatus Uhrbacteria bacterium GW2011_GWE2_45_35]
MALLGKKDLKEVVQEVTESKEIPSKAPELAPVPVLEKTSTTAEVIGPPAGESVEAAPTPAEVTPPSSVPQAAAAPVVEPEVKDELEKTIENILSEDLTDLFLDMNPEQQEAFREKGEETASKIREILNSTKINIRKIVSLIIDWLRMVPGVNKFFLEKEAKIKTDKILLSSEDFRQEGKL